MNLPIKPQPLLEMFGIDQQSPGALYFLRLTYTLWMGAPMGKTVREMAEADGISTHQLYSVMKRTLRPILTADPETLRALDIVLERGTSTELAYKVAQNMRKEWHF